MEMNLNQEILKIQATLQGLQYEISRLKCMVVSLSDKKLPGELEELWHFSTQRAKELLKEQNKQNKTDFNLKFEDEPINEKELRKGYSIIPVD